MYIVSVFGGEEGNLHFHYWIPVLDVNYYLRKKYYHLKGLIPTRADTLIGSKLELYII